MAGRGPAPAETRRRSNAPARGEWVDLPPLEKRVLPKLPAAPPLIVRQKDKPPRVVKKPWSPRTKAAWEAWARDPVTAQYGPAEIAAVIELAYVMEDYVRGIGMPNEVRLRMDGLGLSPKGKRDLRWRVTGAISEAPTPGRSRAGSSSSRRSRLSIVR